MPTLSCQAPDACFCVRLWLATRPGLMPSLATLVSPRALSLRHKRVRYYSDQRLSNRRPPFHVALLEHTFAFGAAGLHPLCFSKVSVLRSTPEKWAQKAASGASGLSPLSTRKLTLCYTLLTTTLAFNLDFSPRHKNLLYYTQRTLSNPNHCF
jgi:hypothetical protein